MDVKIEEVVEDLKKAELPRDQVKQVSTNRSYHAPGRGFKVVLVDFGMKHGILRELTSRDCDVLVVPYNTSAEKILKLNPDGIMLSNGPGDPKEMTEGIEMIKGVLGKSLFSVFA